ncbi:uncharacterized protein LOC125645434 isoform X3 [Ostrea edulis]|nr:uncharacterized protein LOC125645434 isoform X3 [Ostrea edulis]XP_048726893.1 uncharacterized protein LOC125645434 isoform X3 [Ostrea edulis]XP_048726894.1 uncharacterized protein LOC125645434 isoform X3 [Ostrea edulis]XP_048726895.1 uncharacterized protein LOC125645434 isoform X3 [Ostrea edulis]
MEKDASRPFFKRQEGEIGVYVTVYDATAHNPKAYGSEHFYFMELLDKLHEQLNAGDFVKMRAALERKGEFKGAYIERFEKGIVLVIGFDDIDALENIWKLHKSERMNGAVQDVLITQPLLKKLEATRIVLTTRMFDDEYTNCKNELLSRSLQRISIKTKKNDMDLLQKLKNFQNKFNDDVQDLQEREASFGKKLGEFMMIAKQILPVNVIKIKSVKEFETIVKVAKGTPRAAKKLGIIDQYFDILKKLKTTFSDIEEVVSLPLLQMHQICETDKQRDVKPKIQTLSKDILQKFRPDANLQMVSHPGWGKRLLKTEHDLFLGLLSLVPIGTEAAFDINCLLDEYINDFPL